MPECGVCFKRWGQLEHKSAYASSREHKPFYHVGSQHDDGWFQSQIDAQRQRAQIGKEEQESECAPIHPSVDGCRTRWNASHLHRRQNGRDPLGCSFLEGARASGSVLVLKRKTQTRTLEVRVCGVGRLRAKSRRSAAVALRHTRLRTGVEPGGCFTPPQAAKWP